MRAIVTICVLAFAAGRGETVSVAPLAASAPSWLYGADWDLLRVTRRGVDAAGEAVGVECLYQFFRISIR